MPALKILQFCNKPPYPAIDGGCIGMNNLSHIIHDVGFDLQVFSLESDKHPLDIQALSAEYLQMTQLETAKVFLEVKPLPAFVNLIFSRRSYNFTRFFNKKVAQKLSLILKQNSFDWIILESIFLKDYLPIIRKYSQAKVLLRAPNVEFIIWQRMHQQEKNPFKKFYLNVLQKRIQREERSAWPQFDAILTVTQRDLELIKTFGFKGKTGVLPTGLDVTKNLKKIIVQPQFPSIFHIGALDWRPNIEGLQWFLAEVWPELQGLFPNLNFYIAGRRPPQWLLDLDVPGVKIVGEVADAAEFMTSKAIMPVPLFSGSGLRVKIIEAMSLSKAIVSTSVGIEGIVHEDGTNVLLAESKADFIRQISRLIQDEPFYHRMCQEAAASARIHYAHDILCNRFETFILSK